MTGSGGATDRDCVSRGASPGLLGVAPALPAIMVAASLAGLLLLWSLAAGIWPSRAFPPPSAVWQVIVKDTFSGELSYNLGRTLCRVAASFVVAMVLGT